MKLAAKMVLMFILPLTSVALGSTCDQTIDPHGLEPGRTMHLQLPGGNGITLMAEISMSLADMEEGMGLLTQRSPDTLQSENNLKRFLQKESALLTRYDQDLETLQHLLRDPHPPTVIGIQKSEVSVEELRKGILELSLNSWVQQHYLNIGAPADWNRLTLSLVGPVFYLNILYPELFATTQISSVQIRDLEMGDKMSRDAIPGWHDNGSRGVVLFLPEEAFTDLSRSLLQFCQKAFPVIQAMREEAPSARPVVLSAPRAASAAPPSSTFSVNQSRVGSRTYWTWWTTDRLGHRYFHEHDYPPPK